MWNGWTALSVCSTSCGTGRKSKSRRCSNPAPAYGGRGCPGYRVIDSHCNIKPCPINGAWSQFSDYRSCSKSCGGGTYLIPRLCCVCVLTSLDQLPSLYLRIFCVFFYLVFVVAFLPQKQLIDFCLAIMVFRSRVTISLLDYFYNLSQLTIDFISSVSGFSESFIEVFIQ